jgi:hypothetical protein
MQFITHNNVLIKGHNRLVKIPSKNEIICLKAHEVLDVGGLAIHLMLGKTLEKECTGGYGMLCIMHVLDKFEPKEATNLVSLPKCLKQILDKFSSVMPEKLPPKKRVDHVIEVMSRVAPPTKAPYQMSHEKLKEFEVQLEELLAKRIHQA